MLKYVFYIVMCRIAWKDAKEKKIGNKEVLLILGLGVLQLFLTEGVFWQSCLLGSVIVSVPMLLLAMIFPGCFGGGDIKLMAAGGFFLGAKAIVKAVIMAVFSAGIYCIWLLIWKKDTIKKEIAFGPFLCLGMFAAKIY